MKLKRLMVSVPFFCMALLGAFIRNGHAEGVVYSEQQEITDTTPVEDAWFGNSVSVSGQWLAAGSHQNSTQSTTYAGVVYVYKLVDGKWTLFQTIMPSNLESYDLFGYSVSIQGTLLAIAAINDNDVSVNGGAVYLYKFDGSQWNQVGKITTPAGAVEFGRVMDLDQVGDNYVLIGTSPTENMAYFYDVTPEGSWTLKKSVRAAAHLAAIDENTAVVNASRGEDSSVLIYENIDDQWQYKQSISSNISGDSFGFGGLDIYGTRILAAAKSGVYVYEKQPDGQWIQTAELDGCNGYALGLYGDTAITMSCDALLVYQYDDGGWSKVDSYPDITYVGGDMIGIDQNTVAIPQGGADVGSVDYAGKFQVLYNAPTVGLTSPTNGQIFTTPAAVHMAADAESVNGIAKVEFLYAYRICTDTTAPYECTPTIRIPGTYTLTARVTDNAGIVTTSAPVTIQVKRP